MTLTSTDTPIKGNIEVDNGFAGERQQRGQQSISLASQNTREDGRLREKPQNGEPGLDYCRDGCHVTVFESFGITASICAGTTGSSQVGVSRRVKERKTCVE